MRCTRTDFNDRRPKVLIFPTNAVCTSFYRELRNPLFPNRYAEYLERGRFADAKKALELTGILRNGCVAPEFVTHPELPSVCAKPPARASQGPPQTSPSLPARSCDALRSSLE